MFVVILVVYSVNTKVESLYAMCERCKHSKEMNNNTKVNIEAQNVKPEAIRIVNNEQNIQLSLFLYTFYIDFVHIDCRLILGVAVVHGVYVPDTLRTGLPVGNNSYEW